MKVKIKYFSNDYPRLKKFAEGDFIDLRVDSVDKYSSIYEKEIASSSVADKILQKTGSLSYSQGDVIRFGLGVAMELPEGYEAHVVPRSSTFGNWGFLQTNGKGVIDQKYCGDNDQWLVEFVATRSGTIDLHDRVCQFRIQKNQPDINFEEVSSLDNKDRGGHGSSGRK